MDKLEKSKMVILLISIFILIIIFGLYFYNQKHDNNLEDKEKIQKIINQQSSKILILYFSQSGNTKKVANFIHDEVGGNIVKLETEIPYPTNLQELYKKGQEELDNNARPKLKTKINVDDYDVIFVGYPIWGSNLPMAWYSFFDEYDLSEKILIPFTTHGGSGLSKTDKKIQNEEPKATVLEGLAIYGSNASESKDEVIKWLERIGVKLNEK